MNIDICMLILVSLITIECSPHNANGKVSRSDLSNILGVLSKHTNMHSALKEMKTFKQEGSMLKEIMQLSPMFQQLFQDLGDKNAKVKIAFEVMRGHVPTLKDLVDILQHSDSAIDADMKSVIANSKPFQRLTQLFNKSEFASSKDDIEKSIYLLTGHHIDIQSGMVQDVNTGKYQLVDSPGNRYWNLVQCILFFRDNWHYVLYELTSQGHGGFNSVILPTTLKMDLSHLTLVRGPPHLDDAKYSISGRGSNPVVTQILMSMKALRTSSKHSNENDFDAILQISMKLLNVVSGSIQEALDSKTQVIG